MNRKQAIEATKNVMRFRHMSIKTERGYIGWLSRYITWCQKHPSGSTQEKLAGFLSNLATRGKVTANTQRQALNAIAFFYKRVLQHDLGELPNFMRARKLWEQMLIFCGFFEAIRTHLAPGCCALCRGAQKYCGTALPVPFVFTVLSSVTG